MIITVDTGGTKTLVSSFNDKGEAGEKFKFPTPLDPPEYIGTLISTLLEHYEPSTVTAIVIGVPGHVKDNVLLWCGNLPWKNLRLADELAKHFNCPIAVQNDADLAGLSEINLLDPVPTLGMYVTISTGIGCALLLNGRLVPELTGIEAGHMMLEYDGKLREWESFASGRAIHSLYNKYAYEIDDPKVWRRICETFVRGFSVIIPTLQPEVIIIGGSVGTHYGKYGAIFTDMIDDTLRKEVLRPRFVQARNPEEAVIYGCNYYAVNELLNKGN